MATFELMEDGTYRVDGKITQEDVEKINAFKIRTNLVLQNTNGQTSQIISQIHTNHVYFSILGGVDYYAKDKFNQADYRQRTQSNPKGLTKILQYFETVEAQIKPEWTDIQKCMYVYNALATDMDYVKNLEQDILATGVTERSLNGILYNQLTCAGMAKTLKEMLDRLGINCYYQNQRSVHDFNVAELDGKFRGLDVTWDCTKSETEKCSFRNFGRDADFYKKYGHQIAGDDQEEVLELTPFTDQEIQENYAVIESAINERQRITLPFQNFARERKRKFLPVDTFLEELQEEKSAFIQLKVFSQINPTLQGLEEFTRLASSRYGFANDYIGSNHGDTKAWKALEEIGRKANISGNLILKDGQVMVMNCENGERTKKPFTQEQQEAMMPILSAEIQAYYTQYFQVGAQQMDELTETYTMLQNMPPEMAGKVATLKAQVYTKMKMFAYGDTFWEQLGIPKEEIAVTTQKAKECLESEKVAIPDSSKPQHEYDLDYLYAIIQDDVLEAIRFGREYTEENLAKLVEEVRANWQGAEFSDEEFRILLNGALARTVNCEEIRRDTVNTGIGLEEINAVIGEIKRSQILEKQQGIDK